MNLEGASEESLLLKRKQLEEDIAEYKKTSDIVRSHIYCLYLQALIRKDSSKIRQIDAELALRRQEASKKAHAVC